MTMPTALEPTATVPCVFNCIMKFESPDFSREPAAGLSRRSFGAKTDLSRRSFGAKTDGLGSTLDR
jgi:hypothetical protein